MALLREKEAQIGEFQLFNALTEKAAGSVTPEAPLYAAALADVQGHGLDKFPLCFFQRLFEPNKSASQRGLCYWLYGLGICRFKLKPESSSSPG